MKDEDSEDDGDISCPFCNSEKSCDHLLLFFDVTFDHVDGGVVEPYDFDEIVAKWFVKALRDGKNPSWHWYQLDQAFEKIDEEWAAIMLAAEVPELPESLPIDFVFELLIEAGGWEHPGNLYDRSGGYCESALRVSYAEDPPGTLEKAKKILAEQLEKDINPPPKRQRKKKGA